jgi:hypothetical protein
MRTSPANVGEGDDVKSKSLQPKLMINLTEEEVWSGPANDNRGAIGQFYKRNPIPAYMIIAVERAFSC